MLTIDIKKRLQGYLKEDLGKGDVTSALIPQTMCTAEIRANEKCLLAGVEEAKYIYENAGLKVKVFKKDGMPTKKNDLIFEISGNSRKILERERISLNILGRMCGVATLCLKARKICGKTKTVIAATRKTVPGFQLLDKRAAEIAGCWTHRKTLGEMILLKDNHLKFFPTALHAAEKAKKSGKKFEIEAENEWDAIAASLARPDIIMLDNFSPSLAKSTVKNLRTFGFSGKIELSGGIKLKNLRRYVNLGADIISMGELTKSAKILDFSMDIVNVKK